MESIKLRFLVIVSIVVIVTMAISTFISVNIDREELKKDQTMNVALSVNGMKDVIAQGLWNFEEQIVESSVSASFENPNLSKVIVTNPDCELVYGLMRGLGGSIDQLAVAFDDPDLQITELVIDGSVVGELSVVVSDQLIIDRIRAKIIYSFIQALIIMGLVLGAIIIILQHMIFTPVYNITEAFKDIAAGDGDLSKRIDYKHRNEIGRLVHYFNEFIEKIHGSVNKVDQVATSLTSFAHTLENVNASSVSKVSA